MTRKEFTMNCGIKCLRKLGCMLEKQIARPAKMLLLHGNWTPILTLVVLLLISTSTFAAEASEETIAVFKAAIEAFDAIEHPLTGRGSAVSEMYDSHPSFGLRKTVIDFMFKGDLSRSTRFSMKEGNRDQQEMVWAVGEKYTVARNYGTDYAIVSRVPPGEFNRELGYNCNPDAFMCWYLTPVSEQLRRLLNGPASLSTKVDSSGILHLITDYEDQKIRQRQVISIDPAKGYRLVAGLKIRNQLDNPERSHTDFLDINWEQYGSSWYIKDAQFDVYNGVHSAEDRSLLKSSDLRRSAKVTVADFHPNVEIDDSEFTLDGLDFPIGIRIIDKIAGFHYRYRVDDIVTTTEMLKEPLSEAEFPKSIRDEIDTKNVKQVVPVGGKQTGSEEEMATANDESAQDVLGDTLSDQKDHGNVLLIVASILGVVLVLVVGLKLFHIRKVR